MVLSWDYYPQIRLGEALGSTPSPIYIEPYSLCTHNCANMHATPHFVSEKNVLTLPFGEKKFNLSWLFSQCYIYLALSPSLMGSSNGQIVQIVNILWSSQIMNSQFTIRVNIPQNVGPTKWKTTGVHTISPSRIRVNKNRAKNISWSIEAHPRSPFVQCSTIESRKIGDIFIEEIAPFGLSYLHFLESTLPLKRSKKNSVLLF